MHESDLTSLDNLGGGAAVERFNDALSRVIENIMDVNTDDKAREITLKVKLKPNASRQRCDVIYAVSTKTSPAEALTTTLYVGKAGGDFIASEYDPKQMRMEFAEAARGENVVEMRRAEA